MKEEERNRGRNERRVTGRVEDKRRDEGGKY